MRLADGQEVLVYRLNGVDGGATDRLEEQQRVFLWWDDQDARAFAAGDGNPIRRGAVECPGARGETA